VVNLDIDKIRQNTPSLCQSRYPTHPTSVEPGFQSPNSSGAEIPATKSPDFDWINANPSGIPTSLGDISWQSTTAQPYTDADNLSEYLASNQMYQFGSQNAQNPGSTHLLTESSANAYPQTSHLPVVSEAVSFQPMGTAYPTSHPDTMELPYAESFAWPFQTSSDNPTSTNGNLSAQNFDMYSGQQPLTSEDIAAFMRINPGEHPFM